MKLYQIPKGSKIFCESSDGSTYIIFNHIDGMYSHCTTEKGDTVHLGASTELIEVEGGYKLAPKIMTTTEELRAEWLAIDLAKEVQPWELGIALWWLEKLAEREALVDARWREKIVSTHAKYVGNKVGGKYTFADELFTKLLTPDNKQEI